MNRKARQTRKIHNPALEVTEHSLYAESNAGRLLFACSACFAVPCSFSPGTSLSISRITVGGADPGRNETSYECTPKNPTFATETMHSSARIKQAPLISSKDAVLAPSSWT